MVLLISLALVLNIVMAGNSVDFDQKSGWSMFTPTSVTISPDPIDQTGTSTIKLEGNWSANATDLFGVVAKVTMDSDQTATQLMYYCRDGSTTKCTKPSSDTMTGWSFEIELSCDTWIYKCEEGLFSIELYGLST